MIFYHKHLNCCLWSEDEKYFWQLCIIVNTIKKISLLQLELMSGYFYAKSYFFVGYIVQFQSELSPE